MAEKELSNLEKKYPNNSKKAKELVEKSSVNSDKEKKSEKKIKKVVKGTVKQKKKNKLSAVGDELIEEDAPSVFSYIVHDVAIPAVKELFFDIICGGTEKLFLGTESGRGKSRSGGNRRDGSYVFYTSYYDRKDRGGSRRDDRSKKGRFHSEDYLLETRAEASDVLDQLVEFIDRYDEVSISDFKDAIGVTSEYTDENWGWTNLRSASIRAVRGGFVIHLPSPTSLL